MDYIHVSSCSRAEGKHRVVTFLSVPDGCEMGCMRFVAGVAAGEFCGVPWRLECKDSVVHIMAGEDSYTAELNSRAGDGGIVRLSIAADSGAQVQLEYDRYCPSVACGVVEGVSCRVNLRRVQHFWAMLVNVLTMGTLRHLLPVCVPMLPPPSHLLSPSAQKLLFAAAVTLRLIFCWEDDSDWV